MARRRFAVKRDARAPRSRHANHSNTTANRGKAACRSGQGRSLLELGRDCRVGQAKRSPTFSRNSWWGCASLDPPYSKTDHPCRSGVVHGQKYPLFLTGRNVPLVIDSKQLSE
jgi:hypothetical protein